MKISLFRKLSVSLGLMAIVVLFAGCPYSSSVPIDEGTVKVSDQLPGNWMSIADTGAENPTYFVITKDDKFHATAKKMEFSTSDNSYAETVYHLTFSDVNGETFMNAIENDGTSYSLLKINFDPKSGEVTTSEVTDYIKEKFSSSPELKAFIAKNKSNSYFFTNTSETYVHK